MSQAIVTIRELTGSMSGLTPIRQKLVARACDELQALIIGLRMQTDDMRGKLKREKDITNTISKNLDDKIRELKKLHTDIDRLDAVLEARGEGTVG